MGQFWKIVNIDSEEAIEHSSGLKLAEFFWSSQVAAGLINLLLVRPSPVAGMADVIWPQSAAGSRARRPTSSLLAMPTELLLAIFDEVTSLQDALCLALAHEQLGAVAGTRLCQLITAELAPWIGQRIVCFGDYTDDFPPHLDAEIKGKLTPADECGFWSYARKYKHREVAYVGRLLEVVASIEWMFNSIVLSPGEAETLAQFLANLKAIEDDVLVPLDSLVICNLTKGVFVRGSALQKKFDGRLSLGTLLLSHICWSNEGDGNMGWSRHSVVSGRWTGHRFEITTAERMRPEVKWTDVSEAYVSHLAELWNDKGW